MMRFLILLPLILAAVGSPLSCEAMVWVVTRVLTGETYTASEEIHRLRGIIAPQTETARHHLEELILGREIEPTMPRPIDNAGRLWVQIHDELGNDVGAQMIRDGYALAELSYTYDHSEEYLQLELEARRAGRGLWSDSSETSMADRIFGGDSLHCSVVRSRSRVAPDTTNDENLTVYIAHVAYHRPGCWYLGRRPYPVKLGDIVRHGTSYPCGMCNAPILDTTSAVKR